MTLSTSARAITIKDNLINIGFSSTGTSAANYTYASNVALGGDAIISGNTFTGCIGNGIGATNLVTITSGSSIVTNNNFIRGVGSPVTTYIAVTSASDQVIKDNIFDQSTTDGTVEDLVSGLSISSTYHRNTNQIAYIPIFNGQFSADSIVGSSMATGSIGVTAINNYTQIYILTASLRHLFYEYDINALLPDDIKILHAKVGIFNSAALATMDVTNNNLNLSFVIQETVSANYTTGTNSILDVKNRRNTLLESLTVPLDLYVNYAASAADTVYLICDVAGTASNADNFIVSKNNSIKLKMSLNSNITVLGSGNNWLISPIVLKCIW